MPRFLLQSALAAAAAAGLVSAAAGETIEFPRGFVPPVFPECASTPARTAAAPAASARSPAARTPLRTAARPARAAATRRPSTPVRVARRAAPPTRPSRAAVPEVAVAEAPAAVAAVSGRLSLDEVLLPTPAAPPLVEAAAEAPVEAAAAAVAAADGTRPAAAAGAEPAKPSRRATRARRGDGATAAPPSPTIGWGWIAAGSLAGGVALLALRPGGGRRRRVRSAGRWVAGTIPATVASADETSLRDLAVAPAVAPPRPSRFAVRGRPFEEEEEMPFHDAIERRLRHRDSAATHDLVRVARFQAGMRSEEIQDMAESGDDPVRIARRIGLPLGEIETVLGVERRRGGARAAS